MKRWGKWGALALGVVVLVAFAGRGVISQQPAAAPPTPPSPYADLFEKARPHLEAVLGTKLDTDLQFSTATRLQMVRVPEPDLDAHLRWNFPHLQGETLQQ